MRSNSYYVLVITYNIVAAAPLVCGAAHKNVKSLNKIFKTNVKCYSIREWKNEVLQCGREISDLCYTVCITVKELLSMLAVTRTRSK